MKSAVPKRRSVSCVGWRVSIGPAAPRRGAAGQYTRARRTDGSGRSESAPTLAAALARASGFGIEVDAASPDRVESAGPLGAGDAMERSASVLAEHLGIAPASPERAVLRLLVELSAQVVG